MPCLVASRPTLDACAGSRGGDFLGMQKSPPFYGIDRWTGTQPALAGPRIAPSPAEGIAADTPAYTNTAYFGGMVAKRATPVTPVINARAMRTAANTAADAATALAAAQPKNPLGVPAATEIATGSYPAAAAVTVAASAPLTATVTGCYQCGYPAFVPAD